VKRSLVDVEILHAMKARM